MDEAYIVKIARRQFYRLSLADQRSLALQELKKELDGTVEQSAMQFASLGEAVNAAIDLSDNLALMREVIELLRDFVERFSTGHGDKQAHIYRAINARQWPEFLDGLFRFWNPTRPITEDQGGYELFLILFNAKVGHNTANWHSTLCNAISRALDDKALGEKELKALEEWIIDPRTPLEFQKVMRRIHAKNEPLEIFTERIKAKHVPAPQKEQ